MQVLVLRFDYKLSTKIENDIRDLSVIAKRGNENPFPPHISLFSFEHVNPSILNERLKKWIETQKQVNISFSSLGFFKTK
jgi:hypothetical protein